MRNTATAPVVLYRKKPQYNKGLYHTMMVCGAIMAIFCSVFAAVYAPAAFDRLAQQIAHGVYAFDHQPFRGYPSD